MLNTNDDHSNSKVEKFAIESYDLELHDKIDLDGDDSSLPAIQGILVHVIIVIIIVFNHLTSDGNGNADVLETALVSTDELVAVQDEMKKRRSQADTDATEPPPQGNTEDTSKQDSTVSQPITDQIEEPSISNFAKELLSSLPQKIESTISEQLPEENIQPVETVVEEEANEPEKSEKIAIIEKAAKNEEEAKHKLLNFNETPTKSSEDKMLKKTEKKKADKKEAEKNKKKEAEKRKEQEKKQAEEQQKQFDKLSGKVSNQVDKLLKESKTNSGKSSEEKPDKKPKEKYGVVSSSDTGKTLSLGGDEPLISKSTSEAKQPTNKIKNTGSSKKGDPNAIRDKIMVHFNPPTNSGSDKTVATITVNDQGDVISVVASGDNPLLNKAAEQAVRAASPLPHVAGDNNHTLTLKGEGNN